MCNMNKTILIPQQNLLPTYYFYRLLRIHCNSKLMKKRNFLNIRNIFNPNTVFYCAPMLIYYYIISSILCLLCHVLEESSDCEYNIVRMLVNVIHPRCLVSHDSYQASCKWLRPVIDKSFEKVFA